MKKETEVKAFEVKQYCDACGDELTFTGEVLLSNPPKYVHICDKCGKKFTFSQSYPCIEHKKVERNPITNIEITDSFKETLKRVSKQCNENNKPGCNALTFALNDKEAQEYHDFCNKHRRTVKEFVK